SILVTVGTLFRNKLRRSQGLHSREACEAVMETLGQRLARGEPAAFTELYDACADRCHHYLVTLLGSRDAADEVLQETFLRLVRKRHRLAGVGNLTAFVFTIARNEACRYAARRARALGRQAPLAADDLFLEAMSDDPAAREMADLVSTALGALNAEQREVVHLETYAGL